MIPGNGAEKGRASGSGSSQYAARYLSVGAINLARNTYSMISPFRTTPEKSRISGRPSCGFFSETQGLIVHS